MRYYLKNGGNAKKMTDNQITVAMEKFAPFLPRDGSGESSLRSAMKNASNGCMDGLMSLKLKSTTVTILLAVFLGGVGAARFYLKYQKIALFRILMTVVTALSRSVKILGTIISIVSFIWIAVDIFLVAKRVKQVNLNIIFEYLAYHRDSVKKG